MDIDIEFHRITNEDKNERICITASNYIHIP